MTGLRLPAALLAVVLIGPGPARAAVTLLAATVEGVPSVARYSQDRQGPEQTERFSQVYTVGADGALDLQNIAGNVRITTARGDQIQIEAVKRVRHRDTSEARRLLEALRIEVTQAGNRVQVRTTYPRTNARGLSASVDYTILVPEGASATVKTISGDVSVDGVRGEVRAESVSGDVAVTRTPNVAVARTVSGNVAARDIGAEATLSLGTVSGNVVASALKVRSLEAGTVSGDVRLSNIQVERLQAKSVSGNIQFESSIARGSHYAFNSHSGNVRVVLPNASGFDLDASTFSGSIRSDFPVTLRSPAPGDRRGATSRAIRGTFGDASAILEVRSFSGTVVITRK